MSPPLAANVRAYVAAPALLDLPAGADPLLPRGDEELRGNDELVAAVRAAGNVVLAAHFCHADRLRPRGERRRRLR